MLNLSSIKHRELFLVIPKFAKKIYSKNFILIFTSLEKIENSVSERIKLFYGTNNTESKKVFIAIKASKKLGKAVIRNKIKRRIRALFQQITPNFVITATYLCLVIPRREIARENFALLQNEFSAIMNNKVFISNK